MGNYCDYLQKYHFSKDKEIKLGCSLLTSVLHTGLWFEQVGTKVPLITNYVRIFRCV